MPKLSGEFQTDLTAPEALVACAEAIDRLGWRIESVEGDRIVSYAGPRFTPEVPRVEVVVSDSADGTDLRIIGTVADADPLGRETLAAELDRVRDAIGASIENAGSAEQEPRGSVLTKAPLFSERPLAVQIVTAAVVPAAFGAVSGVILGVSAAAYWALQAVALIGGVLGGLEHPNGREAAIRGLVGGTIYGAFLLLAHAVEGSDPTVKLPDFAPILVVFTAIFGMLASALGGRLRARSSRAGR
jgi:hypothetical protein